MLANCKFNGCVWGLAYLMVVVHSSQVSDFGVDVSVGISQLRDGSWAPLALGPVVALVHAASVLPDTLEHVVDALHRAPNVTLSAVLAPEQYRPP